MNLLLPILHFLAFWTSEPRNTRRSCRVAHCSERSAAAASAADNLESEPSSTSSSSRSPLSSLRNIKKRPLPRYLKTDHLWLQRLPPTDDYLVWLDLENIRGNTGFAMTHSQLLENASAWAGYHNLTGHVVVVADHGSVAQAYTTSTPTTTTTTIMDQHHDDDDDKQTCPPVVVVFSGDRYNKADDLLADWVGTVSHSVIVTADAALQSRCRRASISYQILEPVKFLDDVERILLAKEEEEAWSPTGVEESDTKTVGSPVNEESPPEGALLEQKLQLGQLDDEIRLRGQIMDTQVLLDKKVRGTNKRRKKLQAKLDRLQTLLARRGPSLLDQVTSLENESTSIEQSMIFQRYKELHSRRSRKEQTGDRVLLAEDLRRQLEADAVVQPDVGDADLHDASTPANRFLQAFNERFSKPSHGVPTEPIQPLTIKAPAMNSALRRTKDILSDPVTNPLYSLDQLEICAISDTHGFEGQLLDSSGSEILPFGDILLHLGDFSLEGTAEVEAAAWSAMDAWLARQPHPIKIIVRGNHDPFHLSFPLSGAWYITEPATIELTRSLTLGVIPYGSSRKLSACKGLPKQCNILASHVPPLNTLDRTMTGTAAGSGFLNKIVAPMQPPPKLWLCGHIHEGRGVATRGSTTVINAANANRGRATHLDHGAVVVRVDKDDTVTVLNMEDKVISKRVASNHQFFPRTPQTDSGGMLLAIDLGLKSGVALFSSAGKLLRYEQFLFNKDDIPISTKSLLKEWEQDAREAVANGKTAPFPTRITHVAIEGADSYLLRAWMDAADGLCILRVSPDEWRAELLLEKERTSGSNAKAASRLIARQVVADFGGMSQHQGKFPTDVAEAVCLGLYVSGKLGWIQRDGGSIVSRYTNGNIIVPR